MAGIMYEHIHTHMAASRIGMFSKVGITTIAKLGALQHLAERSGRSWNFRIQTFWIPREMLRWLEICKVVWMDLRAIKIREHWFCKPLSSSDDIIWWGLKFSARTAAAAKNILWCSICFATFFCWSLRPYPTKWMFDPWTYFCQAQRVSASWREPHIVIVLSIGCHISKAFWSCKLTIDWALSDEKKELERRCWMERQLRESFDIGKSSIACFYACVFLWHLQQRWVE